MGGSKRDKRTVNLADFLASKQERTIVIELDSGNPVRLPAPELWSDEVMALAKAEDNVGAAKALLGDDEYARFTAAGGSAVMLFAILKDVTDADMGESSAS